MSETVSIFGAGAFGTSLAQTFANNGVRVFLWARNSSQCDAINATRKNLDYSGDLILDSKIHALPDFAETTRKARIWIYACSSSFFRQFCCNIKPFVTKDTVLIDTSKGVEPETLLLHSQIVAEVLGKDFASENFQILSGPSFAKELFENIPTSVSLAGLNLPRLQESQRILGATNFRLYISTDPIGCQIGGAAKNVVAIALGVAEGLGLGQNSRAALMNRGLIEVAQLGHKLGARSETFLGLSCLGDLLLTCSSLMSRNFRFGTLLGKGLSLEEAKRIVDSTIEGVQSASAVYQLAKKNGLDLPICSEVYAVLHAGKSAKASYEDLLKRPQGTEWF